MATVQARTEQGQYLTFVVGGEEYAIGILRVKEILEYDTLTKVPQTPASIRGVVNLRGCVVPVVDLAAKFGLPASPLTSRACIVIVEADLAGERKVFGLLADAVSQVMDLDGDDIEPPPAFGTGVHVDYLAGLGKVGKKFVFLLDADRVLSAAELLASARAISQPDTPTVTPGMKG